MCKATFETKWNALRKAREAVTNQLDQIEARRFAPGGLTPNEIAIVEQLDVEDERLFNVMSDLEDARLARPARSRHDVLVKLKILARRAGAELDIADQLETIVSQIEEWRQAEPVILSCAGRVNA